MHAYADVIAHGDPICSTYSYITQKYKDRQNAITEMRYLIMLS